MERLEVERRRSLVEVRCRWMANDAIVEDWRPTAAAAAASGTEQNASGGEAAAGAGGEAAAADGGGGAAVVDDGAAGGGTDSEEDTAAAAGIGVERNVAMERRWKKSFVCESGHT
ncbi:hypothetical protein NLG97_g7198 [Lecanicillium saksenae]|uniref:Uncharacterized protein n=1 Tax=Lecanicillium saksenae TaxID=468837 RepID=A0ACC1QPU2_9HYPO|nr:hypothetical protein NLG97_g7198 [Lecanicillium saksenae]